MGLGFKSYVGRMAEVRGVKDPENVAPESTKQSS